MRLAKDKTSLRSDCCRLYSCIGSAFAVSEERHTLTQELIGLLHGENIGKRMVKVSDESA